MAELCKQHGSTNSKNAAEKRISGDCSEKYFVKTIGDNHFGEDDFGEDDIREDKTEMSSPKLNPQRNRLTISSKGKEWKFDQNTFPCNLKNGNSYITNSAKHFIRKVNHDGIAWIFSRSPFRG
ncbi:hypothetical protein YC2023_024375 [Brassica napus]